MGNKMKTYLCDQCGKETTGEGSWQYNGEKGRPDAMNFCSEKCIKDHLDNWIAEIKKEIK